MAEYIKENSLGWSIGYSDETEIDDINIKKATYKAMHKALSKLINPNNTYNLLIDGNEFTPYMCLRDAELIQIPHTCIVGGDNTYSSIAAASILAKVERDEYIKELCNVDPLLNERYDLLKNKGYGTKKHMEGIKKYGISKYHRKTFGICKNYV